MGSQLAEQYSNRAIAEACNVTDTTVRNGLKAAGIRRNAEFNSHSGEIPVAEVQDLRRRAVRSDSHGARQATSRPTKDRISRIVAMIGKEAGIVVKKADPRTRQREKFASAHDLRRGCAQRLINAGISAESLKVIMRHKDFATTKSTTVRFARRRQRLQKSLRN